MEIDKWGPKAWGFLHASTFAYPDRPSIALQQKTKQFYELLGDMLPCKKCGRHWKEQLKVHKVQTESKDALSRWLVDRHNEVNAQNNKRLYSYDEVCEIYDPDCNRCEVKQPVDWMQLLLWVVLALCLAYGVYKILT